MTGVKSMRSLVVDAEGNLTVRTLPVPAPGDCQALVRMRACGICNGTDSKLIHRTFKGFHTYPAALGHEGVGEVVQLGEKCTALQLGDRVLLPFLEGESEGVASGWGAFSEYALVGDAAACARHGMGEGTPRFNEAYLAQTVLPPAHQLDDGAAVMMVTFREVLSAIRRFALPPNSHVAVFGCGPVGQCFIRFLRLLGMGQIIAVDISDSKVRQALAMGATAAFNGTEVNVPEAIRSLVPGGVDAVIDAVGNNALIQQAMGLLRDHGRICCYGISPQTSMTLDWQDAPYNWSLHFVQWPSKREEAAAHGQVMAWMGLGVLDPSDFISHRFPFDRVLDAFALLEARHPDTRKIIVHF